MYILYIYILSYITVLDAISQDVTGYHGIYREIHAYPPNTGTC